MSVYGKVIVIRRNGSDGSQFPLTSETCLFGRGMDCDVRVQLAQVSAQHCKAVIDENGNFVMTNLSKTNTTSVNGKVIEEETVIKHQDVLTIVDRSFRFEFPDQVEKDITPKNQAVAELKSKSPLGVQQPPMDSPFSMLVKDMKASMNRNKPKNVVQLQSSLNNISTNQSPRSTPKSAKRRSIGASAKKTRRESLTILESQKEAEEDLSNSIVNTPITSKTGKSVEMVSQETPKKDDDCASTISPKSRRSAAKSPTSISTSDKVVHIKGTPGKEIDQNVSLTSKKSRRSSMNKSAVLTTQKNDDIESSICKEGDENGPVQSTKSRRSSVNSLAATPNSIKVVQIEESPGEEDVQNVSINSTKSSRRSSAMEFPVVDSTPNKVDGLVMESPIVDSTPNKVDGLVMGTPGKEDDHNISVASRKSRRNTLNKSDISTPSKIDTVESTEYNEDVHNVSATSTKSSRRNSVVKSSDIASTPPNFDDIIMGTPGKEDDHNVSVNSRKSRRSSLNKSAAFFSTPNKLDENDYQNISVTSTKSRRSSRITSPLIQQDTPIKEVMDVSVASMKSTSSILRTPATTVIEDDTNKSLIGESANEDDMLDTSASAEVGEEIMDENSSSSFPSPLVTPTEEVPSISLTGPSTPQTPEDDPYNFPGSERERKKTRRRSSGSAGYSRKQSLLLFGSPRTPVVTPLRRSLNKLRRSSVTLVEGDDEHESPVSSRKKVWDPLPEVEEVENNSSPVKQRKFKKRESFESSPLLFSEPRKPQRKSCRVSFGPQLSPEQFLRHLPPNTPVKKGAVASNLDFVEPNVPASLRRKSMRRSCLATVEESILESPKTPKSSINVTTRTPTPFKAAQKKGYNLLHNVLNATVDKNLVSKQSSKSPVAQIKKPSTPKKPENEDIEPMMKRRRKSSDNTPIPTAHRTATSLHRRRSSGRVKNAKPLWSEIVKRGAAVKQTAIMVKKNNEIKSKKIISREEKLSALNNTRHVDSPATMYIGRTRKFFQSTKTPKNIKFAASQKNIPLDESFTGMPEMFDTPNVNSSIDLKTPESVGEMYVSPGSMSSQRSRSSSRRSVDLGASPQFGNKMQQKRTSLTSNNPDPVDAKPEVVETTKTRNLKPRKVKNTPVKEHFGTKRLFQSPKPEKNTEVTEKLGTKRLLKTPKLKKKEEPVESHFGTKRLLKTPKVKQTVKPVEEHFGTKRLLTTPKERKRQEPVEEHFGTKRLLTTPKEKKTEEPVKEHFGTKRIFCSPRAAKSKALKQNFNLNRLYYQKEDGQKRAKLDEPVLDDFCLNELFGEKTVESPAKEMPPVKKDSPVKSSKVTRKQTVTEETAEVLASVDVAEQSAEVKPEETQSPAENPSTIQKARVTKKTKKVEPAVRKSRRNGATATTEFPSIEAAVPEIQPEKQVPQEGVAEMATGLNKRKVTFHPTVVGGFTPAPVRGKRKRGSVKVIEAETPIPSEPIAVEAEAQTLKKPAPKGKSRSTRSSKAISNVDQAKTNNESSAKKIKLDVEKDTVSEGKKTRSKRIAKQDVEVLQKKTAIVEKVMTEVEDKVETEPNKVKPTSPVKSNSRKTTRSTRRTRNTSSEKEVTKEDNSQNAEPPVLEMVEVAEVKEVTAEPKAKAKGATSKAKAKTRTASTRSTRTTAAKVEEEIKDVATVVQPPMPVPEVPKEVVPAETETKSVVSGRRTRKTRAAIDESTEISAKKIKLDKEVKPVATKESAKSRTTRKGKLNEEKAKLPVESSVTGKLSEEKAKVVPVEKSSVAGKLAEVKAKVVPVEKSSASDDVIPALRRSSRRRK